MGYPITCQRRQGAGPQCILLYPPHGNEATWGSPTLPRSLVTCIPSSPQRKCKVDLLEGQHCPSIHCRKASLLAHLNIQGRQAISRSKAFLSLTARWLQGPWESQMPCLTSAVTKNRTCNKSEIPFFCQSGISKKGTKTGLEKRLSWRSLQAYGP